jgi:hypothetical protein
MRGKKDVNDKELRPKKRRCKQMWLMDPEQKGLHPAQKDTIIQHVDDLNVRWSLLIHARREAKWL